MARIFEPPPDPFQPCPVPDLPVAERGVANRADVPRLANHIARAREET